MKKEVRIVLKGRNYQAPQTESVEITNQGVLCSSGCAKGFPVGLQGFKGSGW